MDTLFLGLIVISWILCYGIALISAIVAEEPFNRSEYKDVLINAFWMFGLSWIFGFIVWFIIQLMQYNP